MKRSAEKDLDICNKATKGPWFWEQKYEINSKRDKHWALSNPKSSSLGKCIDGALVLHLNSSVYCGNNFLERANTKFIAESREALPYWIQRAVNAEKLLREVFDLLRREELPTKPLYDRVNEFLGGANDEPILERNGSD